MQSSHWLSETLVHQAMCGSCCSSSQWRHLRQWKYVLTGDADADAKSTATVDSTAQDITVFVTDTASIPLTRITLSHTAAWWVTAAHVPTTLSTHLTSQQTTHVLSLSASTQCTMSVLVQDLSTSFFSLLSAISFSKLINLIDFLLTLLGALVVSRHLRRPNLVFLDR